MATEYKPQDVEVLTLQNTIKQQSESVQIGKEYTALDWNIGYAGLDKDEDFLWMEERWSYRLIKLM